MTKNTTLIRSAVLLLAIGFATPAFAQHRGVAPSSEQAFRMGPLIGMEFTDGDTGFALRGDASIPLSRLSHNMTLDGVLSAGFSWFSYGHQYAYDNVDVTLFKLVPALRLTIPLTPTVGIYGDAGVGFYFDSIDYPYYGPPNDNGFGATMRFAGGLFADVSPVVRIGGELGVNPYFGDYDQTNVTLMFSAMFKL